ncbi:MAG: AmmeMemoRadiSam system protein B [Candidatus Rifleibacteriota bacterium]
MYREPFVAGRFYEGNREGLKQQIEQCFRHPLGIGNKDLSVNGRLLAMISPHAGYMFSGPPASHGYARLKLEQPFPERVVLLGPKHTQFGPGFSISNAESWQTPLGSVKVDRNFAMALADAAPDLRLDDAAHQFEHSIEVQLPFLQYIYQDKPLKIVPIALGYTSFGILETLVEKIKDFLDGVDDLEKTLIIVSSDFSHDTPREEAYRLDGEVIDRILALDAKGFFDLVDLEDRSVCGLMPIAALLLLIEDLSVKATRLTYSTSMDIMRHERGVGYASIIFEEAE